MALCEDWVRCLQWVVYVPVILAGLPLNMAALWLLLFRVRRWSESTVYLSSLVINDSLLIITLPFKIHAYNAEWTLGSTFCSLLEGFVYVNIYGSILLSVCISVDRYVALRFPFASRRVRSPRKAGMVCVAVWALLFGCSYPVHSIHSNNNATNTSSCFQNFSKETWRKWWIVVCMEIVFCSCAAVMVFCSVEVVRILHHLRKGNPNDAKLRNNKSVKIVLSNLVVFLVFFIPYHVAAPIYFAIKVWNWDAHVVPLRKFVHGSICMSSVNCLADGVCYYFILKENLQMVRREGRGSIYTRETHIPMGHKLTQTQKHTPACDGLYEDTSDTQTTQK